MSLNSDHLQRFVRLVLVEAAGGVEANRSQFASGFISLRERLRQHLEPPFGSIVVTELFTRALSGAAADFPWLSEVIGKNGHEYSANAVAAIQHVDVSRLEDGFATVLTSTIGLLNTFIGQDLVLPLVHEAWGGDAGLGPARTEQ
jgi:hypothetical protein